VLRFVVHRHSTHDGGDSIHLPSFSLGRSNAVAADALCPPILIDIVDVFDRGLSLPMFQLISWWSWRADLLPVPLPVC